MKRTQSTKVKDPEAELHRCQEAIGYLFRREGLLRKALTHSSVKDEKHPSNERLEFLGDAILGMVISEYLFSLLPENDEGDLTKVKSVVVSSQTLSRLGEELGLDRFLLLGRGIRLKDEIPRSLLANAVEAIIAAVYLDRGMEAARHFVLDHLHRYVEEVLKDDHQEKNYKSLLQQYAQKELNGTPVYRVLSETGPDHSKRFRVAAVLGKREYPAGFGSSKKEAEQDAARTALRALVESRRSRRRGQARKPRARPPRAETRPEPPAEKGPERKPAQEDAREEARRAPAPAEAAGSGRASARKAPARRGAARKAAARKAAAKKTPAKTAPARKAAAKKAPAKKAAAKKAPAKKAPAKKAPAKKVAARKGRRRPRATSSNGR